MPNRRESPVFRTRTAATVLAAFGMLGLGTARAQTQLAIATYAQITLNSIDFGQYPTGAPFSPAPGYGSFDVISVQAGEFFSLEGVTSGESGSIQSLNDATAGASSAANAPFVRFAGGGSDVLLFATDLTPGSTIGPLTLSGTIAGTILSFDLTGVVSSTTVGTLGDFTLICAASFSGMSPTQLIDSLDTGIPIDTALSCTVAVVQTSQQATGAIIAAVAALHSQGVLNRGRSNSLTAKLQRAINKMNAGNDVSAIAKLDSFIDEVNDLLSSAALTSSQATPLIGAAEAVIARLK